MKCPKRANQIQNESLTANNERKDRPANDKPQPNHNGKLQDGGANAY